MNPNPATPPRPSEPYDDEISIAELLGILRARWKWVAISALGAPLVAFLVTLALPRQYEASVLVELAKVGNPDSGTLAEVESREALTARMNRPGFIQTVADPSQQNETFSLKASVLEETGLVKLELRASSAKIARESLAQVINKIALDHAEASANASELLKHALQQTETELAAVTQNLARLNNRIIDLSPARQDPVSALLLAQTQNQLSQQQFSLQKTISRLQWQLFAENMKPTQAIEPIYVNENPVSPKTNLIVLLAFLAGGFGGVLLAFLAHAVKANPVSKL
jgi:uncharacterized protein involved in exopolysaccharide biosynthesis